ncbi:hypothetical protein OBE_04709 [human gut metagenome]|uniref:Uncharacterized protein n=1 Tax=human gut metagenome TaxID=408170 RepID=K1TRH7_9ZZZZ
MGNPGNQRDYEPVHYRLAVLPNPRMFSEYGRQKGWERENPATDSGNPSEKTMDGFVEVTEQMELPF